MSAPHFSEFERILIRGGNELGTAVFLLLTWIAASDGDVDEKEIGNLQSLLGAADRAHEIEPIIRIATAPDLEAIQLAAEIVQNHFTGERAPLFMQMAIGVAVADGHLTVSENYILRFVADLIGLTARELNEVFRETTAKPLPEPSDPSSADWWEMREHRRQNRQDSASNRSQTARRSTTALDRIKALAILGLEEGASPEEVRDAYRRLVHIHHPDRFVSLGDEAVAAASLTFQRIKQAYDYLSRHA